MTVEEKAVEIADNAKRQKYFDDRCNDLSGNIAYQSAMIMAEWKDAQFKEYLEKKLKEKENRYSGGTQFFGFGQIACIEEIINELFGGE